MKHLLFQAMMIISALALNTSTAYSQDTTANRNTIKTDTIKYATLYVYRKRAFAASLASYDVHVGDSTAGTIENNSKFIVKLYKEGPTTIWAKTEKKISLNLDVKFGQEYFLKCGYSSGILLMRPQLELIFPGQGQLDFDTIEEKKPRRN